MIFFELVSLSVRNVIEFFLRQPFQESCPGLLDSVQCKADLQFWRFCCKFSACPYLSIINYASPAILHRQCLSDQINNLKINGIDAKRGIVLGLGTIFLIARKWF